jgi:hypothetical protein
MGNDSAGTLVWTEYKEPPKKPDTRWIAETVRGAFSLPSEGIVGEQQEETKERKKAVKSAKKENQTSGSPKL